MNSFGELHSKLRIERKITRAELAQHIHKDPSYIRRIEIENYVPPFEICELIASKFDLKGEEKLSLYKAAFYKRIDTDMPFYRSLIALESGLKKEFPQHPSLVFSVRNNLDTHWKFSCNYWITWETTRQSPILVPPIDLAIENFLARTIQDLELQCYSITLSQNRVCLLLEITPEYKIEDLITNLKTLSSGFLHTKFPNLNAPTDIWDQGVTITTVGAMPELEHRETSENQKNTTLTSRTLS